MKKQNTFSSFSNPEARIFTPSIARQQVYPWLGKVLRSLAQESTHCGPEIHHECKRNQVMKYTNSRHYQHDFLLGIIKITQIFISWLNAEASAYKDIKNTSAHWYISEWNYNHFNGFSRLNNSKFYFLQRDFNLFRQFSFKQIVMNEYHRKPTYLAICNP